MRLIRVFFNRTIYMNEIIDKALQIIRDGGVILYPTDTVWGIGCDATNSEAVRRVLDIKHSVDKKGMIVLIDSIPDVGRYFKEIPSVAWDLLECADKPLTLILPGASGVAPVLIPEEGTLAIRVPQHDFCHRLLAKLRRPLVSTSANISGKPTPVGFDDIDPQISAAVDFVVDPRCEGNPSRKPSSMISLGTGGEISIIRP